MPIQLNPDFEPGNALPDELEEKKYTEYLSACRRLDREELLKRAYTRDPTLSRYQLDTSLAPEEQAKLAEIFSQAEIERWGNYATVTLVAFYIWCHRQNVGRQGNADDDRRKAEYLVNYVKDINRLEHRAIPVQMNAEMEEIIELVNNIFDTAYFRKIEHPNLSDEECFFSAEREFREVEQETRLLAQRHFEWRTAHNEAGDEQSDWEMAKRIQPRWHATKRIATIYWNLAPNKHRAQDYYWYRACEIVNRLEAGHIKYVDTDPYERSIYEFITADISAQGEARP